MNRLKDITLSLITENKCFNASFILMSLAMLTLPFTTFLMWPIAIGLAICFVAENNWKEKLSAFKENSGIPYGIFLLSIYLIPMTGFINSSDTAVAWALMECYLWFLIAPLVIMTISTKTLTLKHINFLITLFVCSVTANILFLFILGITKSIIFHDTIFLYYSHFSILRHPTYVSLYATFAFFIVLKVIIKKGNRFSMAKNTLLYISAFILALGVFCLYSRAGILIFFFLILLWSIYLLIVYPRRWKRVLILYALIIGAFALLMTTDIMPVNRFAKTKYNLDRNAEGDNEKGEARIAIWKSAAEGIKESLPFGTGTGDAFDVIKQKSIDNGYNTITDRHYNSHNQYLQALLTNGIPGLILLSLYFVTPFAVAVRRRDMILFTLFILLAANCVVECMFDIRAGVDFFAIMIPLMIMKTNYEHKIKKIYGKD